MTVAGVVDGGVVSFRPGLGRAAEHRVVQGWQALAHGTAAPRLADVAPERQHALVFLDGSRFRPAGEIAPLHALIRSHAAGLRTAAAPLRFRAALVTEDAVAVWRGLLLPFADAAGTVVALEMVGVRHERARLGTGDERHHAAVALALSAGGRAAPAANPWQSRSAGTAPDPDADAHAHEAGLWAALAVASPSARAQALPRALAAALALRAAQPAEAPIELIERLFGPTCPREERTILADLITRADALGLSPAGLAAALNGCTGDVRAMAVLLAAPAPADDPTPENRLEWEPFCQPSRSARPRFPAWTATLAA